MLRILADSFRIATLTDRTDAPRHRHRTRPDWPPVQRSDLRSSAELEAHLIARRRY